MVTDKENYPCDFCKRDDGLLLTLSRYKLINSIDSKYNEDGFYFFDNEGLGGDIQNFYNEKKNYMITNYPRGYSETQWYDVTQELINKNNVNQLRNKRKEELEAHWNKIIKKDSNLSNEKFNEVNKIQFDYVNGGVLDGENEYLSKFDKKDVDRYAFSPLNENKLDAITLQATIPGYYFLECKNIYNIETPKNLAYDLALLRKGFVYVYSQHLGNEALEKYEVSPSGYLKKVELLSKKRTESLKKEPCEITVHRIRALTISIRKPKEASDVWIKYSEVEWTEKIEKKSHDLNFRNDCMNIVNIPKILQSQEQMHVTGSDKFFWMLSSEYYKIKNNEKRHNGNISVLNYSKKENINLLGDQYIEKYKKKSEKEILALIASTDEQEKLFKGLDIHANVILTDVVGLLMDVGGKLIFEKNRLVGTSSELSDEEKTFLTYQPLKQIIKDSILNQEIERDIKEDANIFGLSELRKTYIDKNKSLIEEQIQNKKILDLVEKRANKILYDYWSVIDPVKYNNAKNSIALRERSINDRIEEIGGFYIKLLSNPFLLNSFQYDYDENDLKSNVFYTIGVLDIVRNSMVAQCVLNFYKSKLTSKIDDQNILLKAYAFNNEKLAEIINNQQDMREIAWADVLVQTQALFDEFKAQGVVENVPLLDTAKGAMDEFMSASSPALIATQVATMDDVFNKSGKYVPKNLSPALTLICGYANMPVNSIEFNFKSHDSFYKNISTATIKAMNHIAPNDQKLDDRKLIKELRKVKLFNTAKESMSSSIKFTTIFPQQAINQLNGQNDFEKLIAATFSNNLNKSNLIFNDSNDISVSLDNPNHIESGQSQIDTKLGTSNLVIVGGLAGIFQILNFQSAAEGYRKVVNLETSTKLLSAVVGTITGIAETTIYTISCFVSENSQFRKWEPFLGKKVLPWFGRVGSIFGIITAIFDIYSGGELFIEGNQLEGGLTILSGLFLASSSILFLVVGLTNPIGWALLVFGVLISLALTQIKFDPIKVWLIKSCIGVRHSTWLYKPYKTYEIQQEKLHSIIYGDSNV